MANNHYDAIVVGSGISGGWAAKELTEKGLKVLLLERGRNLEHIKDYTNAHKEVWDYPHRNVPTQQMKEDYPVLKRDFPLNEAQLGWWTDEQKSPYIEDKRFDWYRSYQMGGRSLLWGRHSYRFNKMDFEANAPKASLLIGQSAMKTSRPGTVTWSRSQASAVAATAWTCCPMVTFCRRSS